MQLIKAEYNGYWGIGIITPSLEFLMSVFITIDIPSDAPLVKNNVAGSDGWPSLFSKNLAIFYLTNVYPKDSE